MRIVLAASGHETGHAAGAATTTPAEAAEPRPALVTLHQDHADQRDRDQQMNDEQNFLHGRLRRSVGRCGNGAIPPR